ncbi:SlyX family protein [Comamonas terrigena]|uniref:SlyX family protein n=2 Tax=Comamonas terrigena TaxID=32013 RepID=UPI0028B09169|nr:SlyX family protein [Comamonas terrigena]
MPEQDRNAQEAQDGQDAQNGRLMELEIKLSYMEDLVEQLNVSVYRQQQAIDVLVEEVRNLRRQTAPAEGATHMANLRDELPPHY